MSGKGKSAQPTIGGTEAIRAVRNPMAVSTLGGRRKRRSSCTSCQLATTSTMAASPSASAISTFMLAQHGDWLGEEDIASYLAEVPLPEYGIAENQNRPSTRRRTSAESGKPASQAAAGWRGGRLKQSGTAEQAGRWPAWFVVHERLPAGRSACPRLRICTVNGCRRTAADFLGSRGPLDSAWRARAGATGTQARNDTAGASTRTASVLALSPTAGSSSTARSTRGAGCQPSASVRLARDLVVEYLDPEGC